MRLALPTFLKTTTFKLALIYSAMFAAFSAALLVYLYYSTVYYIRTESERRMDLEFEQLGNAYFTGGMERLSQSVLERMTRTGSTYFYYLEDSSGRKIAGHFGRMPTAPPAADVQTVYFEFRQQEPDGTEILRQAAGRIVRLRDNGGALLVAFDTEQQTAIVGRIQRAIFIAAPIGLVFSLLGGILISRGAARRADELARTAVASRLNAMLDQIEKLVDSTRHTGNAIAHDLRSPLSRLRNRLEIALSEPMSRESAEATLEVTVEEVDRVLGTFNAILRLARLEAGAEGERVRMDVSELGEELAELFDPACEEAGLSFKSQISRNLTILADRDLVGQALSNLLDNAVKYTPEGGAITFSITRGPNGTVDMTVVDSGPGVPEGSRELVVQRFQRMDSARTQPGSGLGLALVDSVADMHGGSLILSDAGGDPDMPGLKATLRLPRV